MYVSTGYHILEGRVSSSAPQRLRPHPHRIADEQLPPQTMTITEFATLAIKSPYHPNSPELLVHLREAAKRQSAWSGYPLHFFFDDTSRIYLLSGWKSVEAHYEWIRSTGNQELMEVLADYLEVEGLVHADVELDEELLGQTVISWERHEYTEKETMGAEEWKTERVGGGRGGWGLDTENAIGIFKVRIGGAGVESEGVK